MEYTIENEYLKLTVTTWGAQVKSLVRKCDGVEHIWQADASVWGYHAPILFPHTGKVPGGVFEAKGKSSSARPRTPSFWSCAPTPRPTRSSPTSSL